MQPSAIGPFFLLHVPTGRSLSTIFDRPLQPQYKLRFEPFVRAFGQDFTIRLFDRGALYRACVVADFLHCLGYPDYLYDAMVKTRIRSNPGLSAATVSRPDRINTLTERLGCGSALAGTISTVAAMAISRLPGSVEKYRLPTALQQALAPAAEAEWRWVAGLVDSSNAGTG